MNKKLSLFAAAMLLAQAGQAQQDSAANPRVLEQGATVPVYLDGTLHIPRGLVLDNEGGFTLYRDVELHADEEGRLQVGDRQEQELAEVSSTLLLSDPDTGESRLLLNGVTSAACRSADSPVVLPVEERNQILVVVDESQVDVPGCAEAGVETFAHGLRLDMSSLENGDWDLSVNGDSTVGFSMADGTLTPAQPAAGSPITAFAMPAGDLSDAEILHVLEVVNTGEITQANLAVERAENEEVVAAAQQIIQDHTLNEQLVTQLSAQVGAPEPNALSAFVNERAMAATEILSGLEGAAFDCAYLQVQVDQHLLAIVTATDQLLPEAEDEQVREVLTLTVPALEQHLDMSRSGLREACQEDTQAMTP